MENSIIKQWSERAKHNGRETVWKRAVYGMAGIVVFCTVYALILPAITMTAEPVCGLEEHTHTEECYTEQYTRTPSCSPESLGVHRHTADCYDADGNLVCGYADFLIHEHTADCYDAGGNLICNLPEIREHTHTDDCYEIRRELICGQEETPGHVHDENCYEEQKVLVCSEDHEHTDECYEIQKKLICTQPEKAGHTHTDACYKETAVLVCGQEEITAHTHDESCRDADGNLICGLMEVRTHTHDSNCIQETVEQVLTCGKEEHVHTDACYPQEPVPEPEETDAQTEGTEIVPFEDTVLPDAQVLMTAVDDTQIKVTGQLPDGAEVRAVPVQVEMPDMQVVMAFDITIVLPDGSTYEPPEGTVQVDITSVQIPQEGCDIYYVPETGKPQPMPSQVQDDTVSFQTPHFSVYAIARAVPEENEVLEHASITDPETGKATGLTWEITRDRRGELTLRIKGEGAIPDYKPEQAPWLPILRNKVSHLEIGDGVTRIGAYSMAYTSYSSVNFGSTVTEIGTGAFTFTDRPAELKIPDTVKKLEQDAFSWGRPDDKLILSEGLEEIGAYALGNNAGVVRIPSTVKKIGAGAADMVTAYEVDPGNPNFKTEDGVLYTKDGTTLVDFPSRKRMEEYRIPEGVTTIVSHALSGIQETPRIVLPSTVKSIPEEVFGKSTGLEEVFISDGAIIPNTNGWLVGCSNLRNLHLPEGTEVTISNMCYESALSSLETFTFPSGTKEIGSPTIGDCPALHTVVYNAKNANLNNLTRPPFGVVPGEGYETDSTASYDLVIGQETDEIGSNFDMISSSAHSIHFKGPNQVEVKPGALDRASAPFTGMQGIFHVDAQGLVYLQKGTELQLVYIPEETAKATIPDTIDGMKVTSVRKEVGRYATNLQSVEIQKPNQLSLESYALANCLTLKSINGRTSVADVRALFTAAPGINAFYNTGLDGSTRPGNLEEINGSKALEVKKEGIPAMKVSIASDGKTVNWNPSTADPNLGNYGILTGDTASLTFSVSNTEGNTKAGYRLYLRKSNEDCHLKVEPGKTYTFDGQKVNCVGTEDPNLVYLDFEVPAGGSISAPVTAMCPSPGSAGGGLTVWGVIPEENAEKGSIIPSESGTMQINWGTKRVPFKLSKTNDGAENIQLRGERVQENGQMITIARPESNLTWITKMGKEINEETEYGQDLVTGMEFTDVMTLPKGGTWEPGLKEAIKAGRVRSINGVLKLDGLDLLSLRNLENTAVSNNLSGLRIEWDDTKGAPFIHWKWNSTNPSEEIAAMDLRISINSDMIRIDPQKYDAEDCTIQNRLDSITHYTHSGDLENHSEATKIIQKPDQELQFVKSSNGGTFMGEDVNYSLRIFNDKGLPWIGEVGRDYVIRDSMSDCTYIRPENMERMFQEAERDHMDLEITIDGARLRSWVNVSGAEGETAHQNSANTSPAVEKEDRLTIRKTEDGRYQIKVENGAEYIRETVAQGLQAAGYAVTRSARYTCAWMVSPKNDSCVQVPGGSNITVQLPGTVKDTFMMLPNDRQNEMQGLDDPAIGHVNVATILKNNGDGTLTDISGDRTVQVNSKREAAFYKNLKCNGQTVNDFTQISDQDILDYDLILDHLGRGAYHDLPLVDDMGGNQCLLVPVMGNETLSGNGLPVVENSGVSYYKLTEGTYHNVLVGVDGSNGENLLADTVTVNGSGSELKTQIKWYFPELAGGDYRLQISYKAIAEFGTASGKKWSISNTGWANDQTGDRLFDTIVGGGSILHFVKDIVTVKGAVPGEDVLAEHRYSVVSEGTEVVYRFELKNTGKGMYHLNGASIADRLPDTYDVFTWEKGTSVKDISFQADPGVTLTDMNEWFISSKYSLVPGDRMQFICWPATASIEFQGDSCVYVYVTLVFPKNRDSSSAVWDQYTQAAGGVVVQNTLYVEGFPSTVSHDLRATGKVLLQKGVSALGWSDQSNGSTYEITSSSRRYYNNSDWTNRLALYYVTLYNEGPNRLYLNPLYDCLPRGFRFLRAAPVGTNEIYTDENSVKTVGGVTDDIWNHVPSFDHGKKPVNLPQDTVYRSSSIRISKNSSGRYVKFEFGAGAGEYSVKWDPVRGKYYLDPQEAIVFTYDASIGRTAWNSALGKEESFTDDIATNTIAMEYDDPLHGGVVTSQAAASAAWPTSDEHAYNDQNNGTRGVWDGSQVAQIPGIPAEDAGEWLVSQVDLRRGKIIPGISKQTVSYQMGDQKTPYTQSVPPEAVIDWKVRLHNEGSQLMWNYTITDTMPAPYEFTGEVTIQAFAPNGVARSKAIPLITITSVKDGKVTFERNGTRTAVIGGPELAFGNDMENHVGFARDSEGNLVMKLTLRTTRTAVTENGGYVELGVSGVNRSKQYNNMVYTNKAMLTPTQSFDLICSGKGNKDDSGNLVSVQSAAPVTVAFGHATFSEKVVTEVAHPDNTAVSTQSDNTILLENPSSVFRYTLRVHNNPKQAMNKLVMIDNLPEPDDGSPFDVTSKRGSEFSVHLTDTPDFQVTVTTKDKTVKVLPTSAYTVEYAKTTDFGGPQSDDWKGNAGAKWTSDPQGARAIRLVIRDNGGTVIPGESVISFSFNAQAGSDTSPGAVAYNSFGYHYGLKGVGEELEAMPLVVGVKVPSVPRLRKELVDLLDRPCQADRDMTFHFDISDSASPAHTAEVNLTVRAGTCEEELELLECMPDTWKWEEGVTYTIREAAPGMPWKQTEWTGGAQIEGGMSFTYHRDQQLVMTCVNQNLYWNLDLLKKDQETGSLLEGAVFALYTPDASEQMTDEAYENLVLSEKPPRVEEADAASGTEQWYLMDIGVSDPNGCLSFHGLLQERYRLVEWKAPVGYYRHEPVTVVKTAGRITAELTVNDQKSPELPQTGGIGTGWIQAGGAVLSAAALLELYNRKRFKKGDDR